MFEGGPEVFGNNSGMQAGLSIYKEDQRRLTKDVDRTDRLVGLYMLVGALRVGHVSQHDFADLERCFAEADLQYLNITPLFQYKSASNKRFKDLVRQTHLPIKVAVHNSKEALCEEHLQLFHEEVLGVVDADKGADDITWFVRPEICNGFSGRNGAFIQDQTHLVLHL